MFLRLKFMFQKNVDSNHTFVLRYFISKVNIFNELKVKGILYKFGDILSVTMLDLINV